MHIWPVAPNLSVNYTLRGTADYSWSGAAVCYCSMLYWVCCCHFLSIDCMWVSLCLTTLFTLNHFCLIHPAVRMLNLNFMFIAVFTRDVRETLLQFCVCPVHTAALTIELTWFVVKTNNGNIICRVFFQLYENMLLYKFSRYVWESLLWCQTGEIKKRHLLYSILIDGFAEKRVRTLKKESILLSEGSG